MAECQAECGSLPLTETDLQHHSDEVEVLSSTYPDKLEVVQVGQVETNTRYSLSISVDVEMIEGVENMCLEVKVPAGYDISSTEHATVAIPQTDRPKFNRTTSGNNWQMTLEVGFLTPLHLHVTLPPDYPQGNCPPEFALSCLWLTTNQLSQICDQLLHIWQDNCKMPILLSWIHWLKHESLQFLSVTDKIKLITEEQSTDDIRVLLENQDLDTDLFTILSHDRKMEQDKFEKDMQVCNVCFEEQAGRHFMRLHPCRHHYCLGCLKQYCQMHIMEGTVQQLQCPEKGCDSYITPDIMHAALEEEEFQRWERLLLQKALDSMGDIVWCPRCKQPVIREKEEQLNLAVCTHCSYCFCTNCQSAWHQGEICKNAVQELQELEEKMSKTQKSASVEEWERMERTKKCLAEKLLSKRYIKGNTKKCPGCKANIEKSEGCNHMRCTICFTEMCYVCGKQIVGYDHFRTSRCELVTVIEVNPVMRVAERPQQAQRMDRALIANPARRRQLVRCPSCRQNNLKEGRNNHMRCWSCKAYFCYQCHRRILGPPRNHFLVSGAGCKQHSDD